MELFSSKIKKFLAFSQKRAFFIFRDMKLFKKLLIYQEKTSHAQKAKLTHSDKISYVLGNEDF